MRECLIRKGQSHILVNMDRGEAFSFNSFGEPIGEVSMGSVRLSMGSEVGVRIVSFVGSRGYADVYFDGYRSMVIGKSVMECVNECRKVLRQVSPIPYRVKHENGVAHILLALDSGTTRGDICKVLGTEDYSWVPLG